MNFEINETEFYAIPQINQLNSYNSKIIEGVKQNGVYNTKILIDIEYLDSNLEVKQQSINVPFEMNLGEKELNSLDIISIDIQVIDNYGLNINYNLNVDIDEVEIAFDNDNLSFEETQVDEIVPIDNVEETKVQVTASYEEVLDNTGVREEIPVIYVEKDELSFETLKDDFMSVKVLFNINVDSIDKVAFKHKLSIEDCYKKLSKDKTRLII